MVDSVSVRFKTARVEKVPLNIRIQWNAGTTCVSECVLKTLACRGLSVGPSKFSANCAPNFVQISAAPGPKMLFTPNLAQDFVPVLAGETLRLRDFSEHPFLSH